jgi:hypothetical protein
MNHNGYYGANPDAGLIEGGDESTPFAFRR